MNFVLEREYVHFVCCLLGCSARNENDFTQRIAPGVAVLHLQLIGIYMLRCSGITGVAWPRLATVTSSVRYGHK
jgi:hypothetical protein